MKKVLPIIATCILLMHFNASSQTTILDFETESTTTTFQYFGSTIDGSLSETIENPDKSGINQSDNVLRFVKPAASQVWAGAFSNPDPATAVDFIQNGKLCLKVWMPMPGGVSVKLENSLSGGDNWILTATTETAGEWVELCYDPTKPSEEGPFTSAAGHVYTRLVIFTYFGLSLDEEAVVFIDDIITEPVEQATTVILDFETDLTSSSFQYFGSSIDGQFTSIISNPDPSGINTSDQVLEYVKPAGAQVWAGAFSNPPTPVDASAGGQLCVKVWSPKTANLAIKLENSSSGPNWITTQPISEINEWVELCFNFAEASIEGPFAPASGHVYPTVVIFFDFGTGGGDQNVTYYMDDLVVKSAASSAAPVTFRLNTSNLGAISDPVYIIGSFNDWSLSNPMESVGNGVYETTIELNNGIYEYQYMVGDGVITESFSGLDECTITSGDGEFTNRRVVVSGAADLDPVCFNSCYNCGESVTITVNLGMGDVTPEESGIFIAGGQAFGPPGGRFRLHDEDGDGVFSITFERQIGFSSYYTFTNGACVDYSCKEDIEGQECANPDNFNDRLMGPAMENLVINTCFSVCTDNTDCTTSTTPVTITDQRFTLYPTVAKDHITVFFNGTSQVKAYVSIISLEGRISRYMEYVFENGPAEIAVADFVPGMYICSIITEQGQAGFKFIKQ